MTPEEHFAMVKKQIDEHMAVHGAPGGVNPPDEAEAAAGTMKDVPDEPKPSMDFTKPDSVGAGEGAGDLTPPAPKAMTFPGTDAAGGFDALAPDPKTQVAASTTKTASDTVKRPKIDNSTPLGYQPPAPPAAAAPVRDTELEGLQTEAARRRGIASVGNVISEYQAQPNYAADNARHLGGGGSSAPAVKSTLWDDYQAEGEQPLKDLQTRRASAAAVLKQQQDAAGVADDMDPSSPRARVLRSVLYKYNPDLAGQLDTATPKQLTAIGGPELTKMIEESGLLEREKSKPDPKAAAASDKAANAESLRQVLLGPAYAEQLKGAGYSPTGDPVDKTRGATQSLAKMDDEGLKALKDRFEHGETNKATIAAGAASANRTEGFRREDLGVKEKQAFHKQQIPGWESDPDQPILDNSEVDAIRSTKIGTDTMKEEIAKAMPIISKYGRALAAGPLTLTAMQQIDPDNAVADLGTIRSLTGTIKELGSVALTDAKRMPNAPGMANIADKIAGNANELSLENLVGGSEATNAKLRAFSDLMDTRQRLLQKSYKYHDASAAPAATGKKSTPPPGAVDSKTINGVTYHDVDGAWVADE